MTTKYYKRIYLDKQPEVGDKIVIVNENRFDDRKIGTEMVVTNPVTYTGNCVFAFNPRKGETEVVHDSRYSIYKDVSYVKVGEQHVTKKLFGITIYRKITEIFEEVDENDTIK